jgi:hypothetical protein
MKLAIVHGELVEQRAEELGDEEDEVDPHFLVVLSNRVPNLEFVNEPRGVSSMILHVPLGPSAAEQMARLPDRSGAELRTAEGCAL